ncbi:HAMP domain-containing sensor histidine kinase [Methanospirillum sp.]|uniref:HAMP domain-containing sensor histidine kinase n=1 Tax=Methanospirillum sp. TaxID=45200 RepID=UPI001BD4ED04|nr:HAMP domain-containing sensor histidine kinase [Methanospirillum sp.]
MNLDNPNLQRRLIILLFVIIFISTASVGIGVGYFAYEQNVQFLDKTTQSVQQEVLDRTEAFFLILAGAEPSIDEEMRTSLPNISRELIALKKPVTLVTPDELHVIAQRNHVDDIYLINETGIIFTTTYPEDMGFDLKSVGLESFLNDIMDSGRISLDRAAVNALNGEITKYAYYSHPGTGYIIETSIRLRDALERTKSMDFTSFLMDDLLQNIQTHNPFVKEIDLFSSNELSQFSLINEGRKMDPEIYKVAKAHGEVRLISEGNLTIYTHFRPKEKEADYTGNLTSMVVYDTSMPRDELTKTAWHTLLVLVIVTIVSFLVSGRLFRRLVLHRLMHITDCLHRIGDGDYSVRIDESGNDEFTLIASEINRMSSLVLAREEELRQLYQDQEKIIEERTRELRKLKDAFEQANIKLTMLNIITRHDIINQLTALSGFLDLVLEINTKEDVREYTKKCRQISEVIHELIIFTRIYEDIGINDPTWQNVRRTIEKAMVDHPDAHLNYDLPKENVFVLADPLFEKVFYTFIDNTLRHGKYATKFSVSYQFPDRDLVIVYKDDGAGIVNIDKNRLFEKGFGKHTGFGLFIAKEILAITQITIKETGEPGMGARFEIFVPEGFWKFSGSETETTAKPSAHDTSAAPDWQ